MHSKLRYSLAAGLLAAALTPLSAQSVTTTPVGAVSMEALANSDSFFSIPLLRPAVFEGTISAISGNVLTLAGADFSIDELRYEAGVQSNTYYAKISTGAAEGQFSTVISNAAGSVTCEYEQDILNNIQVGDKVSIRPYWTLGSLFPASSEGSAFVASTTNFASGRRTEIIFPDVTSVGINKSSAATYFYNGFWRRVGAVSTNSNDVVIPPDSYYVVRTNNAVASSTVTVVGEVSTSGNAVALLASNSGRNDNPVAVHLPVSKALADLGLQTGDVFIASTSNFASGRGDELIVFDNNQVAKNKSSSAVYFYNGYWRKVGDVSVNQNATLLPAGSAVVIRKKQLSGNAVVDWVQPASYSVN